VLTRALLKPAMKARKYRPLVIIDIAVPRDADPEIGKLDGVYLFDIDDLEKVVAANLEARAAEAESAGKIVEHEVEEFGRWLRSQAVVPTIRALRDRFTEVARAEVDKTIKALRPDSSGAEREQAMRRLADSIVNKLLHSPLTALKAGQDEQEVDQLVTAANRLFALDGEEAAAPPADPVAAAKGRQAR
jgi:glutamyl-tRNA reductase